MAKATPIPSENKILRQKQLILFTTINCAQNFNGGKTPRKIASNDLIGLFAINPPILLFIILANKFSLSLSLSLSDIDAVIDRFVTTAARSTET